MTAWQMNGAGDDPIGYYAEVEPRVVKVAEEYRASGRTQLDRKAAHERLKGLIGENRMVADCNEILKDLDPKCDVWVCGIRLIGEKLWPAGDKRHRLHHFGAADTILDSIDFPIVGVKP